MLRPSQINVVDAITPNRLCLTNLKGGRGLYFSQNADIIGFYAVFSLQDFAHFCLAACTMGLADRPRTHTLFRVKVLFNIQN